MKSLILVGGGGHCHACIDVIEATNRFEIVGVVQPASSSETILGYEVVGSDNDLPQLLNCSRIALVTVGQIKNPNLR